jgi:hypothetical protein
MCVKQRGTDTRRSNLVAGLGSHFPGLHPRPGLIPPIPLAVEIGLSAHSWSATRRAKSRKRAAGPAEQARGCVRRRAPRARVRSRPEIKRQPSIGQEPRALLARQVGPRRGEVVGATARIVEVGVVPCGAGKLQQEKDDPSTATVDRVVRGYSPLPVAGLSQGLAGTTSAALAQARCDAENASTAQASGAPAAATIPELRNPRRVMGAGP